MLTHQFSMKPYAILSYNQVLTLNEMFESRDMFDNSDHLKFFTSLTESMTNLGSDVDSAQQQNTSINNNNNNINENDSKSELSSICISETFGFKKTMSDAAMSDSKSTLNEINDGSSERKIDESLEVIYLFLFYENKRVFLKFLFFFSYRVYL